MAEAAQPTHSSPGRTRPHRRRPRPPTTGDQSNSTVPEHNDATQSHPVNGRQRGGRRGALAFRPASLTPRVEGGSEGTARTAGRGGQRGRGSRQRGISSTGHSAIVTSQGRQFGTALTTGDDSLDSDPARPLQPTAPEFTPGGAVSTPASIDQANTQRRNKVRRSSRSHAPDIATRIHEDIENRLYECPICTSEVLRNSKIWSCHDCWTVFHLGCVKQWASNALKPDPNDRSESNEAPQTWRCPGCNLPQTIKPSSYSCWCGKEHEPPRTYTGLPPHSCGQTCSKQRAVPKKCPHPCELMCHAGPCPPCERMGPSQNCFCGKQQIQRKCVETDYDTAWSCGEICGDVMACGEHTCQRECHEGLCGACEVALDAQCYCGKERQSILCCDKDDEKESERLPSDSEGNSNVERWTGVFKCANLCGRAFDCGKHHCEKPCHPQQLDSVHCPRSPDIVQTCPCGKTSLDSLTNEARKSCEDPIPHCQLACEKPLECGHLCKAKCHVGPCRPCMEKVAITCRCGRTAFEPFCHQRIEELPHCPRVCRTTLNCGRHACDERCCSGERKAVERQARKKKSKIAPLINHHLDIEAEHICTRTCGRLLTCGIHTCPDLCHRGPCQSCREAVFSEIPCNCGRTVLMPPQPCGMKPPPCRYPCERPKSCGHPQVEHNCHMDDRQCPSCPFLVERSCLCGKSVLKNQPCSSKNPMCGTVCALPLRCGRHHCRKTCHALGECEDSSGGRCQQVCGKEKPACGHPCENLCHFFACKEDRPCSHKIIITCDCQLKKQEMRCGAWKESKGNIEKALSCDEECARVERNRKLALALDIPKDHENDHIPYSADTLSLFMEFPKWAQEQEREFRVFAGSVEEKRLRFKPMPSQQRTFLHQLADDFGFDSESMDPEPHRHVAIFKTPRFVSAPNKTLRDCIRIRQNQRIGASIAANEAQKSSMASKGPYNGYLLTEPRFGLTIDELEDVVQSVKAANQDSQPNLKIEFMGSGDVALKCIAGSSPQEKEAALKTFKIPLSRAFSANGLGTLTLCTLDEAMTVVRRETDESASGWSQVAAKAAAPRRAPTVQPVGTQSTFTVLSTSFAKKKKAKQVKPASDPSSPEIFDDWQTAEEKAEEAENKTTSEDGQVPDVVEIGDESIEGAPEPHAEDTADSLDQKTGPEGSAA